MEIVSKYFDMVTLDSYTINQIEDALRGATSWRQWRNNLYSRYPHNPTRHHLNELFANWH